jgi:hypothetical protein
MHAAGTVRRECSSRTVAHTDNRGHTRDKTVADARSVMRAVITQLSRSQTRRTKRSVLHESAQKSSPHEEGTTSTRSTVQTEEREPPNLADPDGDTREQDRLYNNTTTCTYVVSVVKSTQQGNQEPTPARCRPTRDDLISSTPQNTQEPRTGRVAGVA